MHAEVAFAPPKSGAAGPCHSLQPTHRIFVVTHLRAHVVYDPLGLREGREREVCGSDLAHARPRALAPLPPGCRRRGRTAGHPERASTAGRTRRPERGMMRTASMPWGLALRVQGGLPCQQKISKQCIQISGTIKRVFTSGKRRVGQQAQGEEAYSFERRHAGTDRFERSFFCK